MRIPLFYIFFGLTFGVLHVWAARCLSQGTFCDDDDAEFYRCCKGLKCDPSNDMCEYINRPLETQGSEDKCARESDMCYSNPAQCCPGLQCNPVPGALGAGKCSR